LDGPRDRCGVARNLCDELDEEDEGSEQEEDEPQKTQA